MPSRPSAEPPGRAMSAGDAKAELEGKLTRILAARIPGFRALGACERLSGGASQETYSVTVESADGDRRLAMRRAPGGVRGGISEAGPGLTVEAKLFAAARAAGVPEPEILSVFEPGDALGEGFLMEWLEGETLGTRIVRGDEFAAIRPKLARQCGEILARIHSIDVERAGLRAALSVHTPEELVHASWDAYKHYGPAQPMIDYAARWLLEHLPPAREPRLVHADFRNGNLMMTPEQGIVGVLDWELAHLGDPVRDLGWVCVNTWRFGESDLPVGGFGFVDDLLEGYMAVSGEPIDPEQVRFWMVFGGFWWAVVCLAMADMYRVGPDRSVERAAVGRRSSEGQIDCVNLLVPGPVDALETVLDRSTLDMPRAGELLASVCDFLRNEVIGSTKGRTSFLTRVAANSIDIVAREIELGTVSRERELARLRRILGSSGELETLRWQLVHGLRDGGVALDREGLGDHLRRTVVDQVAIDQPKYSGRTTALGVKS